MKTRIQQFATSNLQQFSRAFPRLLRANLRTIVVLVAILIFLILLRNVGEGDILELDVLAYRVFVGKLRSDYLTPIMEGFTSLSSVAVVLVMFFIVAAVSSHRATGWCMFWNLGGCVALNTILKNIVQRPRPEGYRLISETGYSFPSGHAMVSMAFFGLLIWLIWRYHQKGRMRGAWCMLFAAIIVAVGVSRVYLGVHYASDVLAGYCVSLLWLIFYTKVVAPAFMPVEIALDTSGAALPTLADSLQTESANTSSVLSESSALSEQAEPAKPSASSGPH